MYKFLLQTQLRMLVHIGAFGPKRRFYVSVQEMTNIFSYECDEDKNQHYHRSIILHNTRVWKLKQISLYISLSM